MDKILTMIIPTYNGGERLKWSLGQLLPLVKNVEDRVSVLVNDNCSTDDTEKTVRDFMSLYPDLIVYHKQKENIGQDGNFFDGVERATTKYVCLWGDDDIVTPVYFDVIFGLLEKQPDLSYVNYNMMDITYDGKFLGMRDNHTVSQYYKEGMTFVKNHQEAPSLITSNVFLREPFLEVYHNTSHLDYPGYNWFYCMLKSIIHSPCYYVGFPIAMDGKPEGGPGWKKYTALYYFYGLGHLFKDLSNEMPAIYDEWIKRHFWVGHPDIEYLIRLVADNRDFYQGENFKKIYPYIESDYYKRLFTLALNSSKQMYLLRTNPRLYVHKLLRRLLRPFRA